MILARLQPKHWALIIGYLASVAGVISGLPQWGDLLKPAVCGGLLLQFAVLLQSLFTGAPPNPNLTPTNNPARRADDPPIPPPKEAA